jgi:hypothetical protein
MRRNLNKHSCKKEKHFERNINRVYYIFTAQLKITNNNNKTGLSFYLYNLNH